MPENENISQNRPRCLMSISIILGLYQIIFAINVLKQMDMLAEISFPPVFQIGLALLWGCIFCLLTVSLFNRHRIALRYSGLLISFFLVSQTLRLVFFANADYDRNRLPFFALITLAILVIAVLGLFLTKAREN